MSSKAFLMLAFLGVLLFLLAAIYCCLMVLLSNEIGLVYFIFSMLLLGLDKENLDVR